MRTSSSAWRELLVQRLLAGEVAIEREISNDGVLFDGGAGFVEVEDGGLQSEAGGADVVTLRPAEDDALHGGVDDGRLTEWIAVGPTEAGADGDGGDVDVLVLEDCGGLVDLGLRRTHARIWI